MQSLRRRESLSLLREREEEDGWQSMPTSRAPRSPSPDRDPPPAWHRPLLAFSLFLLGIIAYSALTRGVPEVPSYASVKDAVASKFKAIEEVALPSGLAGNEGVAKELCTGEHGCRFLVPTTIGEQESRAQLHFLQLAALATSLNRTLVLPRAYPSRFSTCGVASFDFFYDPASFAIETGVKPLLQRDFEAYLANRTTPASARAVRFSVQTGNEPPVTTFGKLVPDSTLGYKPLTPCLDGSTLDLGGRQPLVIFEPHRTEGDPLVEDLRALDEQDPVDVLLVHYNLRGPIFQRVESTAVRTGAFERAFTYKQEWSRIANKALELLGAAAAGVHWRIESIAPETLDTCGGKLVDTLEQVKEENPDVEAVYLASDFAIETLENAPSRPSSAPADGLPSPPLNTSGSAHSDTLTELLTPAHRDAVSSFLSSFASSSSSDLTLHTFASLYPSLLAALPDLERWITNDAARAIVDQLVLQRTAVFLAGFPTHGEETVVDGRTACAKQSTWTNRVTAARAMRWKEELRLETGQDAGAERRLRNVLGRWSAEGQVDGLVGVPEGSLRRRKR
ncbi:hypothetical protein JCM10213_008230 [Rhodosporidiobolus nylandii]